MQATIIVIPPTIITAAVAAYVAHPVHACRQALPPEEPLLRFLASLDRVASPSMPVDRSLWMTALAMPLILETSHCRISPQVSPETMAELARLPLLSQA